METALGVIRDAHQVDQLLGRVAEAVTDSALKEKIVELKEQWQPLCYEVSAALCGVESGGLAGSTRKRRSRKKAEPDMSGESAKGSEAGEESCGPDLA